jgi:hypothetical protein
MSGFWIGGKGLGACLGHKSSWVAAIPGNPRSPLVPSALLMASVVTGG